MVIVDSSVWIDFFKNTNNAGTKKLKTLLNSDDDVCLTGLIYTEIYRVSEKTKNIKKLKQY